MRKNQLSTIAQTNVNKKVDRLTKFLMAQENKKSEKKPEDNKNQKEEKVTPKEEEKKAVKI